MNEKCNFMKWDGEWWLCLLKKSTNYSLYYNVTSGRVTKFISQNWLEYQSLNHLAILFSHHYHHKNCDKIHFRRFVMLHETIEMVITNRATSHVTHSNSYPPSLCLSFHQPFGLLEYLYRCLFHISTVLYIVIPSTEICLFWPKITYQCTLFCKIKCWHHCRRYRCRCRSSSSSSSSFFNCNSIGFGIVEN